MAASLPAWASGRSATPRPSGSVSTGIPRELGAPPACGGSQNRAKPRCFGRFCDCSAQLDARQRSLVLLGEGVLELQRRVVEVDLAQGATARAGDGAEAAHAFVGGVLHELV